MRVGKHEQELLLGCADVRRYPQGRVLFHRGDHGDCVCLLIDGEIEIFIEERHDRTIITRVNSGQMFGVLALLSGGERTASAMTVSESSVAIIGREEFKMCLSRSSELRTAILKGLVSLVDELTVRVSTVQMSAYGRLRTCLSTLAGCAEEERVLLGKWTHESLAEWTGCTRETVAKLMGVLRRGGFVRYSRGRIVIVRRLPATF